MLDAIGRWLGAILSRRRRDRARAQLDPAAHLAAALDDEAPPAPPTVTQPGHPDRRPRWLIGGPPPAAVGAWTWNERRRRERRAVDRGGVDRRASSGARTKGD